MSRWLAIGSGAISGIASFILGAIPTGEGNLEVQGISRQDQLLDEASIVEALFVNSSGREFPAADFER